MMMQCAVIGLGEAGSAYAAALADLGHAVSGYDPMVIKPPKGVELASSEVAAIESADLILVLTAASFAPLIAERCAPVLREGVCYADLTSASPESMAKIATLIESTGAVFADVAILGPIPLKGAATDVIVSGSGAETFKRLTAALGAPTELLDTPAGAATAHKLLRSVFMKGLAALTLEALEASKAAGAEPWIRRQIAAQLAGDGQTVIDRFIQGTALHAQRRRHEMQAALTYLQVLDVPTDMTAATVESLSRITGTPHAVAR